jgi:hypothetical protein
MQAIYNQEEMSLLEVWSKRYERLTVHDSYHLFLCNQPCSVCNRPVCVTFQPVKMPTINNHVIDLEKHPGFFAFFNNIHNYIYVN